MSCINEPVLNIIVVGFHHKKGCQVEHCYPELVPGRPAELPSAWRHLPALALPDGSHNYLSDTIFFHLPGLTEPAHTVYAISCFRQIPIEQVIQKTEDMTRSSVQKSVCVVCKAPLFGRLAVKMELVVRAWFLQGDFSQTKLLEDAFKHLNSCPVQIDQTLEGLSVLRLVESWRHKALLLFKLLLLRRRVLVYGAPAGPLSAALLTLVSLLPRCLDHGLSRAANVVLSRPLSPIPVAPDNKAVDIVDSGTDIVNEPYVNGSSQIDDELTPKESVNLLEEKDRVSRQSFDEMLLTDDRQDLSAGREKCHSVGEKYKTQKPLVEAQQSPTMARDMSVDGLYNLTGQIDHAECGFPLPLFEDGYLCLPYLSLQYLDLLSDAAVQGFVVGASNVLFKQKRQLFDVLVELNEMRIETGDLLLRRQLALGTEDLRFADHVVRHGASQGDAWIRDQFASYLIYLLRTSLLPDGSREIDPYNALFMSAFKATPAYQQWLKTTNNGDIEAFGNLAPIHPFAGQLSVADMKLKFTHTMSTSEGGRKVTAAVASTGRAVATTSRAVGGALSQARGALSGWWTALTAPPAPPDAGSNSNTDADTDSNADADADLAADYPLSRPLSPIPVAPDNKAVDIVDSGTDIVNEPYVNGSSQIDDELTPKESVNLLEEKDRVSRQSFDEMLLTDDRQDLSAGREKCHSVGEKYKTQKPLVEAQQSPTMARDMSVDGLYNLTGQIDHAECGFPLPLFEDGYLCLPYLSLQYLDLLSDAAVQGFVVGASNVLFKQKRQLFDVLVELNEMRIETGDLLLRRQLALGTEDLRFADHVVRHGASQGDAWIRDQFASYLIYLLRTSLLPDGSREIDPYNALFMSAFKATPAYQQWLKTTNNGDIEAFGNLAPIHPFAGQLSVADMKLKFTHTMSTSEGGRKVTAAVASTGRAVATTSRAVGGALSQARGALSGWWTALTAPPAPPDAGSNSNTDADTDSNADADADLAADADNRKERAGTPDPPDKTIDETAAAVGNIQVI